MLKELKLLCVLINTRNILLRERERANEASSHSHVQPVELLPLCLAVRIRVHQTWILRQSP